MSENFKSLQTLLQEQEENAIKIAMAQIQIKKTNNAEDLNLTNTPNINTLNLINKKINKDNIIKFSKKVANNTVKFAALFVIIASVAFTTVFAINSNFVIKTLKLKANTYDIATDLTFEPDKIIEIPMEARGFYYPTYIPEGYKLVDIFADDNIYFYSIFEDKYENRIIMSDEPEESSTSIDTENAVMLDVFIDNKKVFASEKNIDENKLIFIAFTKQDRGIVLSSNGKIGIDELVNVAESIVKVPK